MTGDQSSVNRFWRVKEHLRAGEDFRTNIFEWGEGPVPQPAANQFLVRTLYLKFTPAVRAFVLDGGRYHETVDVGQVMMGRGLGVVLESNHQLYQTGDLVSVALGWQDYALLTGEDGSHEVDNVQKIAEPTFPLYRMMGTLGTSAFTSYFGIRDIAAVQNGDTVVISAAAGGVGSIAGQIAKIDGARVIGIAGTAAKCSWLVDDLGFDQAINYRTENVSAQLAAHCPGGIDVYFDNVGGQILDDALQHLAFGARVIVCGLIATEYEKVPPPGPAHYYNLLYKRARMEGFNVWDYVPRFGEAQSQLTLWLEQGLIKPTDELIVGLEKVPDAVAALFTGGNTGITVVEVAPDAEELVHELLGVA